MSLLRLSRRQILRLTGAAASSALLAACTRETKVSPLAWKPPPTMAPTPTARGPEPLGPEAALARLLEGNQRYTAGLATHPDQTAERRAALNAAQAPFAAVLTCADSRVPPEIIFDQGLGDLFVARVAGNILSEALLGSLEYAVQTLATPLILVLGHERCGAVQVTLDAIANGVAAPGHMASLAEALRPAVEEARQQSGDVLDYAIRANVRDVVRQLRTQSALLEKKLGQGSVKLLGAYASLDTGVVELLA